MALIVPTMRKMITVYAAATANRCCWRVSLYVYEMRMSVPPAAELDTAGLPPVSRKMTLKLLNWYANVPIRSGVVTERS